MLRRSPPRGSADNPPDAPSSWDPERHSCAGPHIQRATPGARVSDESERKIDHNISEISTRFKGNILLGVTILRVPQVVQMENTTWIVPVWAVWTDVPAVPIPKHRRFTGLGVDVASDFRSSSPSCISTFSFSTSIVS